MELCLISFTTPRHDRRRCASKRPTSTPPPGPIVRAASPTSWVYLGPEHPAISLSINCNSLVTGGMLIRSDSHMTTGTLSVFNTTEQTPQTHPHYAIEATPAQAPQDSEEVAYTFHDMILVTMEEKSTRPPHLTINPSTHL